MHRLPGTPTPPETKRKIKGPVLTVGRWVQKERTKTLIIGLIAESPSLVFLKHNNDHHSSLCCLEIKQYIFVVHPRPEITVDAQLRLYNLS